MVYVPAYYPNAASEGAASPLEVRMGAEIRGVDIHLFKRALPHRFRVRGKVTGVQPDAQISISLVLRSSDDGGYATAEPPDYVFETSVPPGQYTIFANVPSGPAAYAMGNVTVTENVNDVVLTMNPPPDVTGRISLAEDGGQVKLQDVRVTLIPLPAGPTSVADVRSDASGNLVFAKPAAPGHYAIDVNVRSIPDGCFVQKVKLGAQEVSLDDFEILTSAQLEIVLSNTAGLIVGSVADGDGKLFPNSSVTLIPTDGKSRPSKQFADEEGNFKFTALRPGKYKLFAWEEIDDGVWQDPEFQKKYEDRANEITVGPSETQNVKLHLIAAVEM